MSSLITCGCVKELNIGAESYAVGQSFAGNVLESIDEEYYYLTDNAPAYRSAQIYDEDDTCIVEFINLDAMTVSYLEEGNTGRCKVITLAGKDYRPGRKLRGRKIKDIVLCRCEFPWYRLLDKDEQELKVIKDADQGAVVWYEKPLANAIPLELVKQLTEG